MDEASGIAGYSFLISETATTPEATATGWSEEQTTTSYEVTPTDSEVATKYIYVKVRDEAGNVTVHPTPVVVRQDTVKPMLKELSKQPEGWSSGTVTITAAVEPAETGVVTYQFIKTGSDVTSAPTGDWTEDGAQSWSASSTFNVNTNGKVWAQAKDSAGNISDVKSIDVANIVSETPGEPTVSLKNATHTENGKQWYKTKALSDILNNITAADNATYTGATIKYLYELDRADGASPKYTEEESVEEVKADVTNLGEGEHTLYVATKTVFQDTSYLISKEKAVTFSVDTTSPVITMTAKMVDDNTVSKLLHWVTFGWFFEKKLVVTATASDTGVGVNDATWQITATPNGGTETITNGSSIALDDTFTGTIKATVSDKLGNSGEQTTIKIQNANVGALTLSAYTDKDLKPEVTKETATDNTYTYQEGPDSGVMISTIIRKVAIPDAIATAIQEAAEASKPQVTLSGTLKQVVTVDGVEKDQELTGTTLSIAANGTVSLKAGEQESLLTEGTYRFTATATYTVEDKTKSVTGETYTFKVTKETPTTEPSTGEGENTEQRSTAVRSATQAATYVGAPATVNTQTATVTMPTTETSSTAESFTADAEAAEEEETEEAEHTITGTIGFKTEEEKQQVMQGILDQTILIEDLTDEALMILVLEGFLDVTALDGRVFGLIEASDDEALLLEQTPVQDVEEVVDDAEDRQNEEEIQDQLRQMMVESYKDTEEVQAMLEETALVQIVSEEANDLGRELQARAFRMRATTEALSETEDPLNKWIGNGSATYLNVPAYHQVINEKDIVSEQKINISENNGQAIVTLDDERELLIYSMLLDAGFLVDGIKVSYLATRCVNIPDSSILGGAVTPAKLKKLNTTDTTVTLSGASYDMTQTIASKVTGAPDVVYPLIFKGLGSGIYAGGYNSGYYTYSSNGRQFAANFDGNSDGKPATIKLEKDTSIYTPKANGFFNYVYSSETGAGTIKNLTVTGHVKGAGATGGLVGYENINRYRFENINIKDITIESVADGTFTGKPAAYYNKSENCAGGLIGAIGSTTGTTSTTTTLRAGNEFANDPTEHFVLEGKEANIKNVVIGPSDAVGAAVTISGVNAGGLIGESYATCMWIVDASVSKVTVKATANASVNATSNAGGAIGRTTYSNRYGYKVGQTDYYRIQNSNFTHNKVIGPNAGGVIGQSGMDTRQSIHLLNLQATDNVMQASDKGGTVVGNYTRDDYSYLSGINVYTRAYGASGKADSIVKIGGTEQDTPSVSGNQNSNCKMAFYTFFEDRIKQTDFAQYFSNEVNSTSFVSAEKTDDAQTPLTFATYTSEDTNANTEFAYMMYDSEQSINLTISEFVRKIYDALFAEEVKPKAVEEGKDPEYEVVSTYDKINWLRYATFDGRKITIKNGAIDKTEPTGKPRIAYNTWSGIRLLGSDKEDEFTYVNPKYWMDANAKYNLTWTDQIPINVDAAIKIAIRAWSVAGKDETFISELLAIANKNAMTVTPPEPTDESNTIGYSSTTEDNVITSISTYEIKEKFKTTTTVKGITAQKANFDDIKKKIVGNRTGGEGRSTVYLNADGAFITYAEFAYDDMRYSVNTWSKNAQNQLVNTVANANASKYFSLINTGQAQTLPNKTMIRMIDLTNGVNREYYYQVNGDNTSKVLLSDFRLAEDPSITYGSQMENRDVTRTYRDKEEEIYREQEREWELAGDEKAEKPQLKGITSVENILQPESYSFIKKTGDSYVASQAGVERYLFIVDFTNTDGLNFMDNAANTSFTSQVMIDSSTNNSSEDKEISFQYSDSADSTTYYASRVDEIRFQSKRNLLLTSESSGDTYRYSKKFLLSVPFEFEDSVLSSDNYVFANDLANKDTPYLDIIASIQSSPKSGSVGSVRRIEVLPSGTEATLIQNRDAYEEDNTKASSQEVDRSDAVFFFKDNANAGAITSYKMTDKTGAAKGDGYAPTAIGTKKKYRIILDFSGAPNFKSDANRNYYLVLEVKRSDSTEFPNASSAVAKLEIPLQTDDASEYGYRMVVKDNNDLNMNLNKENLKLAFDNEFSGKNLDEKNVEIKYSLYKKETNGSYSLYKKPQGKLWSDIKLNNIPDVYGGMTSKNFANGTVNCSPWYFGTLPDNVEKSQEFSITMDDGTTVKISMTIQTDDNRKITGVPISCQDIPSTWTDAAKYFEEVSITGNALLEDYSAIPEKVKLALAEALKGLKAGSMVVKKNADDTNYEDAYQNVVYLYQGTNITFSSVPAGEGSTSSKPNYKLEIGNYKLKGELYVNGAPVASDYIIFNVNEAHVYDPIQELTISQPPQQGGE